MPNDKLATIDEIENNSPVAMIGDGINDAPALAKATVGISLANATQIAIHTSDVILLNKKNLDQLPKALLIGKHTLLTIKQNLFWAFVYNVVAIPLAVMGVLSPVIAGAAMAMSSVSVVLNSLLLKRWKGKGGSS